jgi:hypothetical protein
MYIFYTIMEIDENKTIKKSLSSILYTNIDYTKLYDVIQRANYSSYVCSYLVRSYMLFLYNSDLELPKLNKEFILSAFNAFKMDSCGPKKKLMNNQEGEKLKKYYNDNMSTIISPKFAHKGTDGFNKVNMVNLSYIIDSEAKQMTTCYENHIKLNYFKYVSQFINEYHKDINDSLIKKCKGSNNKKELKKKLKKELFELKNSLIKNNINENPKFNQFISTYKPLIFPQNVKCYETDIKLNPHKYTKNMLYMNEYLEKNEHKMFQPIALRTDVKDKYIAINNNTLLDIFKLSDKKSFSTNLHDKQKDLWNMFFNINVKKSAINGYSFNYLIYTDGYTVSLNYIRNNLIEAKNNKLLNKRIGRDETNKKLKNATDDVKLAHKNEKLIKNYKINELFVQKKKELAEKGKHKMKKLTPEEKECKMHALRIQNNEFNYVEDLVKCKSKLYNLKQDKINNSLVYVDPGKRSIGTFMGENGSYFNYTNKMRLRDTKRLKISTLTDNLKYKTLLDSDNMTVKKIENKLSLYKHKTTNELEFKMYTKVKMELKNKVINEEYYNNYLKKQKWHSYINTQRHESKIQNKLKELYGKTAKIIVGDWNNSNKLSYISTPGIGFKRMLSKKFPTYQLNEHNTSKIHHKTLNETQNLYLKKDNIMKKIYPVLTYQMGCRKGCINRDKNAINNFRSIVNNLLKTQTRPLKFTHNNKTLSIAPENEKPSNLKRRSSNDITEKEIVSLHKTVHVTIGKIKKLS